MAKGLCEMPDCGKPMNGRGMCKAHYGKWLRANNGKVANPVYEPPVELSEEEYDDYWLWVKKELKLV